MKFDGKHAFFKAGAPAVSPAGKFVLEAVWVNIAAVSFDGDDFAENLIRFNRFIKGA